VLTYHIRTYMVRATARCISPRANQSTLIRIAETLEVLIPWNGATRVQSYLPHTASPTLYPSTVESRSVHLYSPCPDARRHPCFSRRSGEIAARAGRNPPNRVLCKSSDQIFRFTRRSFHGALLGEPLDPWDVALSALTRRRECRRLHCRIEDERVACRGRVCVG
jgi:hypothetical protein